MTGQVQDVLDPFALIESPMVEAKTWIGQHLYEESGGLALPIQTVRHRSGVIHYPEQTKGRRGLA